MKILALFAEFLSDYFEKCQFIVKTLRIMVDKFDLSYTIFAVVECYITKCVFC